MTTTLDYGDVSRRVTDLRDRTAETVAGCWEWRGSRGRNGYGYISHGTHRYLAHRVFYTGLVGPVDSDLDLDHLCRNRACVNPEHLEPVTRAVNLERARAVKPRKTHCVHGHSLEDAYTYSWGRCCRTCALARAARQQAEKEARNG